VLDNSPPVSLLGLGQLLVPSTLIGSRVSLEPELFRGWRPLKGLRLAVLFFPSGEDEGIPRTR
jgi:hypothetical protein